MKARVPWARILACPAVALALTAMSLVGLSSDMFAGFQLRAADSIFPRGDPNPEVAVVGIDARAIADTATPWPWPRAMQAELVRRLDAAGARIVVLDLLYAPPTEGDDELAAALSRVDGVVAESVLLAPPGDDGLYRVRETVSPAPEVAAAARAVGETAVVPDPSDGIVRSMPLVVADGRAWEPALPTAALARVEGVPAVPTLRPDGVQIGSRVIPTTDASELVISWTRLGEPPGYQVVSAADVMNDTVRSATLRDKVVFVGVTDPTIGDRVLTPIDDGRGLPGVAVHAQALDTILSRAYLRTTSTETTMLWVFLVALLTAIAVQFAPLWCSPILAVLIGAGYVWFAYQRAAEGVVLNFVYPLVGIVLTFPVAGAVRYFLETRQRRRVSSLFSRYVPEQVARQLLADRRIDDVVAGERLDATVLFCDLRGFTAVAGKLEPSDVRELLNHYYAFGSRHILELDGTVMQFVGDEIFAVFGAPLPTEHHASHAIECALRLQHDRPSLSRELAEAGLPEVQFGIGLNAGPIVAAHVGTPQRRQYAAIGDTVNVGSRLCGQAGAGEIVAADDVLAQMDPRPPALPAGELTLKGVAAPVTAWRLEIEVKRKKPVGVPG